MKSVSISLFKTKFVLMLGIKNLNKF